MGFNSAFKGLNYLSVYSIRHILSAHENYLFSQVGSKLSENLLASSGLKVQGSGFCKLSAIISNQQENEVVL